MTVPLTRRTIPWILLAGAALGGLALRAATSPAAGPAEESHAVTYEAGASQWLHAPETVQFSRGVTLHQDDATLQMDSAIVTLDDEQNIQSAQALSPIHAQDSRSDLRALHGEADFEKRLITVRDQVVVIVKPKDKDKTAPKSSLRSRFKDPATITCDLLYYNYRRKQGRCPGPLTVHQKNRTMTADTGYYDGKAHTITLVGHVHGTDTDGNQVHADRAILGVEEDHESITIPGPVTGVFHTKKDKKDDSDDGAPDAASPPPDVAAPTTPPPAPTDKP